MLLHTYTGPSSLRNTQVAYMSVHPPLIRRFGFACVQWFSSLILSCDVSHLLFARIFSGFGWSYAIFVTCRYVYCVWSCELPWHAYHRQNTTQRRWHDIARCHMKQAPPWFWSEAHKPISSTSNAVERDRQG